MALRNDPSAAAMMAAEAMSRERDSLDEAMGRPSAAADLYLGHLLGLTGADRFVSAVRDRPATSCLQAIGRKAFARNRRLFTDEEGMALSVGDAYAHLEKVVRARRTAYAAMLAGAARASGGRVEVAEAP